MQYNEHTDMRFSLLNAQTLNDQKLPTYNDITKNDHISIVNELNIASPQHEQLLRNDTEYTWFIIPPPTTTQQESIQRIGIRIPNQFIDEKLISYKPIAHKYIYGRNKPAIRDKCAIQYMIGELKVKNLTISLAITYRVPDAYLSSTTELFEDLKNYDATKVVGDFNLDWKNQKTREYLKQELPHLKQIVNKYTRYGTGRNNKVTKTCIDHVWVKPKWSSMYKYHVENCEISDHEIIHYTLDVRLPPRKITTKVKLDRYRRYCPDTRVNWTDFNFNYNHDQHKNETAAEQYEAITDAMITGCDHLNIVQKKQSYRMKTIERFKISKISLQLIRMRNQIHRQWKIESAKLTQFIETNATVSYITIQREIVGSTHESYKKARNKANYSSKNDRRHFLNGEFKANPYDQKALWRVMNQTKGKVTKQADDMVEPEYSVHAMGGFYWKRSKLARNSIYDVSEVEYDQEFSPYENVELNHMSIQINDAKIDEMMNYKPSASPDPDTLSMMIWSQVYNTNETAKEAIRNLFKTVFKQDFRIPGLEHHDVSLYLKVDEPTRQKDFRPVAHIHSIPKRMLKHLFDSLKSVDKSIFYAETDYSAPGRGTVKMIMSTYERLEQGFLFSQIPRNLHKYIVEVKLFDRSNAFNTYDREVMIKNLTVGGPARNLVCNSILDQKSFCVRTKSAKSVPYELDDGGPQGNCGTAELYSTTNKMTTFPDIKPKHYHEKYRHDFVDDTSHVKTLHIDDRDEVNALIDQKMVNDNKKSGLILNQEKEQTIIIEKNPTEIETAKLVGVTINNALNADSELEVVKKKLNKVIAATRACTVLRKNQRITISRSQVLSQLGTLPFMSTYLNITNLAELRKSINLAFKSAAGLPWLTPTEYIEKYLYGCNFDDYCTHRLNTLCKSFIKDDDPLFKLTRTVRRKLRPIHGARFGKFLKKYASIINTDFESYFKKLPRKKEKLAAFKNIVKFKKPNFKKKPPISEVEPCLTTPRESAPTPTIANLEAENAPPVDHPNDVTDPEASAQTTTEGMIEEVIPEIVLTLPPARNAVDGEVDGEEDIEEDLEDAEEEAAVAVTITRKRKRRSPSTSPDHQPARRRPLLSIEVSNSTDRMIVE